MDEKLKIQCVCGMDNELVLVHAKHPGKDKYHYDEKKHGNNEPCNGKCFNCHAVLDHPEFAPPAPAEPEAKTDEEDPELDLDAMDEPGLRKFAAEFGIEISNEVQDVEQLRTVIAAALEPNLDDMDAKQLRAFAEKKQIDIPWMMKLTETIRDHIAAALEAKADKDE